MVSIRRILLCLSIVCVVNGITDLMSFVFSDIAPNASGIHDLDHHRIIVCK